MTNTLMGLGALKASISPAAIIQSVVRITRDLSHELAQAIELTETPKWLVQAIAAYEIRDAPYNTVNPAVGARGVMQITPITAVDGLYFAEKYRLLTAPVQAIFQKYLGARWPLALSYARKRSAKGGYLLAGALLHPEFNILMGALLLRVGMIQHQDTDGEANINKVVLQYNRGFTFGRKLMTPAMRNADADTVYAIAPKGEAKHYVANLLAPNAVIDQLRKKG